MRRGRKAMTDTYEEAANHLSNQFYEWLLESPNNESIMRNELYDAYDAIKQQHRITGEEGYSGFMVGWAASNALNRLGKEGVPNPALITIAFRPTKENREELDNDR